VLVVVLGVLVVGAPPARAHTALSSSVPADGSTVSGPLSAVELTFTGPVTLRDVTVTDPAGVSATAGEASASGALVTQPVALSAAGEYTVGYAVVSSDGHQLEGSLTFRYSPPAPPTPTPTPAVTASPSQTPATVQPREASADAPAPESSGPAGWLLPLGGAVVLAAGVVLVVRRRRTRR
jgi:methionine-rich copper-binding protein CopC